MAALWLLIISVLFCLPGAALPSGDWLNNISFDKWVHVALFTVLLFLWRFSFGDAIRATVLLFMVACFYGLGVELVQHFFISNRSFDLGDLMADAIGGALGLWLWHRYKKNRPL